MACVWNAESVVNGMSAQARIANHEILVHKDNVRRISEDAVNTLAMLMNGRLRTAAYRKSETRIHTGMRKLSGRRAGIERKQHLVRRLGECNLINRQRPLLHQHQARELAEGMVRETMKILSIAEKASTQSSSSSSSSSQTQAREACMKNVVLMSSAYAYILRRGVYARDRDIIIPAHRSLPMPGIQFIGSMNFPTTQRKLTTATGVLCRFIMNNEQARSLMHQLHRPIPRRRRRRLDADDGNNGSRMSTLKRLNRDIRQPEGIQRASMAASAPYVNIVADHDIERVAELIL